LRRLLVAQDVRADRRRGALGAARAARGDVAVQLRRLDDPFREGRGHAVERASVQVRGRHARDRGGVRARDRDRLPRGGRARGDRAARARARRVRAGAARRAAVRHRLRAAAGAPGRARLLQRRRRAPARRCAGARLGRGRDPRRPPLLPAADDAAGRRGDEPGELLPVHRPRGDRPPGRGAPEGEGGPRMSEFDQLYREVILDHYKNPRGHGVMENADAEAEGQNPLCGDEVSIYVAFGEDGDTIDDVMFSGRGCAISQAATSMLTEMVKGRRASEVAAMPKEELLEEIGIPLTPVRLKCAILGLTTLRLALHKGKGTPLPEGLAELEDLELT